MISDTSVGIIIGVILGFGSSIGKFLIHWIARPRISINENSTSVEMNYKQLDSDQVATMRTKELTFLFSFVLRDLILLIFRPSP